MAKSRQTIHTFPPPPLKFRTTGFPQYGFKLAFSRCDLQPPDERLSDRPTCTLPPGLIRNRPPSTVPPVALRQDVGGSVVRAFQSRGPWLAGGFCCPTRSSLTMASSAPLGPLATLCIMATSRCPTVCSGLGPRGSPFSSVYLFSSCHLPYPDGWSGSHWLTSPLLLSLHLLCTGSASITPPSSALRWTASRGCKVRFNATARRDC